MKDEIIKLNDAKDKIKSCLGIIEKVQRPAVQHSFKHDIINLLDKGYCVFSLDTFKWKPYQNVFQNVLSMRVDNPTLSTVYARGHIYQFGGDFTPTRYIRLSLADKSCYDGKIVGVNGGYYISSCFDGDKYIYLVGGIMDYKRLNRVDRFNIDTHQFEHVCQLQTPLVNDKGGLHCHKNNKLYMVNKLNDSGYQVKTFDLLTHAQVFLLEVTSNGSQYQNDCFDGIDNIYIKTSSAFHRITLSSKQKTILAKCPASNNNLLYDPTLGRIFSIGGKNDNYQYSVQNDKWVLIKDNGRMKTRVAPFCLLSSYN
ncbi:hypothetical protein SAMD00019534_056500 [Acytostelium subglobosum LB1]|uniref:hypothetical protein n=1 Tax=Acytostelium subglobosum LB1 TaxID=1410327 RepID=UPI0006450FD2|nr:hypothetical protein SAMD00019534_056500 [Acytostelium subglobosum LB1]GAM22475.1 hypothetical protein SAMD00019534_056500 [Acytostelium subglobosum LB1]|eukprot:XP_012754595.1 hypothetical protein SAMD00019534_056500 [Acytostelium subglobosum LB1]